MLLSEIVIFFLLKRVVFCEFPQKFFKTTEKILSKCFDLMEKTFFDQTTEMGQILTRTVLLLKISHIHLNEDSFLGVLKHFRTKKNLFYGPKILYLRRKPRISKKFIFWSMSLKSGKSWAKVLIWWKIYFCANQWNGTNIIILLLLSFAAFVSSSLSADESVRPDKDACCLRRWGRWERGEDISFTPESYLKGRPRRGCLLLSYKYYWKWFCSSK